MMKQNKYYITKYGEQKSALYTIILMRIQVRRCSFSDFVPFPMRARSSGLLIR